jgi:hypothetical protein
MEAVFQLTLTVGVVGELVQPELDTIDFRVFLFLEEDDPNNPLWFWFFRPIIPEAVYTATRELIIANGTRSHPRNSRPPPRTLANSVER